MAEKRKVWRVKDASGSLEQVLVETSAEQVTVADTAGKLTATNVEDALAEVAELAKNGGVTGVKGDAETEYRKGNVNITKANIGLGNVDNTADANKSVASAIKASQDGDGNVIKNTYATKTEIKNTYATKTEVTNGLNGKLDKTGGTITGSLSVNGGVTVGGNLTVSGTTTTIDSTTLQVTDKLIEVAHGNTTKLTSPAGLVVPKYDGTNSGALVFDGDGMAQVGKVVLDTKGNIDTTKSGLQTLATRTNLVGGNLVQYDSTDKTLVDSGKKVDDLVTTDTEQTITARKRFNDEIVVNQIKSSLGTSICTMDSRDLHIGSFSDITYIRGGDGYPRRPQYEYQVSNEGILSVVTKPIALIDDIKTTKVDNATNADNAAHADTAGKVSNELEIIGTNSGGTASALHYTGDKYQRLTFSGDDFTIVGNGDLSAYLRATGVTAGSYSAVTVDTKGRVTAGGKSIEWGTSGQTAPSNDLMVGGLFFQLQ